MVSCLIRLDWVSHQSGCEVKVVVTKNEFVMRWRLWGLKTCLPLAWKLERFEQVRLRGMGPKSSDLLRHLLHWLHSGFITGYLCYALLSPIKQWHMVSAFYFTTLRHHHLRKGRALSDFSDDRVGAGYCRLGRDTVLFEWSLGFLRFALQRIFRNLR